MPKGMPKVKRHHYYLGAAFVLAFVLSVVLSGCGTQFWTTPQDLSQLRLKNKVTTTGSFDPAKTVDSSSRTTINLTVYQDHYIGNGNKVCTPACRGNQYCDNGKCTDIVTCNVGDTHACNITCTNGVLYAGTSTCQDKDIWTKCTAPTNEYKTCQYGCTVNPSGDDTCIQPGTCGCIADPNTGSYYSDPSKDSCNAQNGFQAQCNSDGSCDCILPS